MVHFIGPQDNYDGRFGVEVNSKNYGLTVHILPKLPFWGVEMDENPDWHLTSYGVGPFIKVIKARYRNVDINMESKGSEESN